MSQATNIEIVRRMYEAFNRGKTSGIPTEVKFFHAWTLRDGKPHRCFVRSTREEGLEAVGLTE